MTDTHREIRQKRIAAGDARAAVIRRTYDAPIDDVWGACTDPERLVRWFLPLSGDLREGGTFSLEGNASGDIVRCDPPRLLVLTWVYGDRPVDEVELRLTQNADDTTVLEIEHATVNTTVDVDGRPLDVIVGDAEAGIWGMGSGWEVPLTYALPKVLRGEVMHAPDEQTMNDVGIRAGRAWAKVLEAFEPSGKNS